MLVSPFHMALLGGVSAVKLQPPILTEEWFTPISALLLLAVLAPLTLLFGFLVYDLAKTIPKELLLTSVIAALLGVYPFPLLLYWMSLQYSFEAKSMRTLYQTCYYGQKDITEIASHLE